MRIIVLAALCGLYGASIVYFAFRASLRSIALPKIVLGGLPTSYDISHAIAQFISAHDSQSAEELLEDYTDYIFLRSRYVTVSEKYEKEVQYNPTGQIIFFVLTSFFVFTKDFPRAMFLACNASFYLCALLSMWYWSKFYHFPEPEGRNQKFAPPAHDATAEEYKEYLHNEMIHTGYMCADYVRLVNSMFDSRYKYTVFSCLLLAASTVLLIVLQ